MYVLLFLIKLQKFIIIFEYPNGKDWGHYLDLKVKFKRKIEIIDCKVITRVEPVNEYMAILYCTLILLLLGLLFRFAKWAVQKRYTASLERFYNLVKRKVGYEVRSVY